MNFEWYIKRHKAWSKETFGDAKEEDNQRVEGICKHIEKELQEIRENPKDIYEWIDVIILAIDGAWRQGHSPETIAKALQDKQDINAIRSWPDPKDFKEGEPVEHLK